MKLKQWKNIFHVIVIHVSTTCNSKQKRNNKTCTCESKNYRKWKKDYSSKPRKCICENSDYLKSIDDTSVTSRTRKYAKGYGFLSFVRKYKTQLLDTGLDAARTASSK